MQNKTDVVAQRIAVRAQTSKNIKSKQLILEHSKREGTAAYCEALSLPGRQTVSF